MNTLKTGSAIIALIMCLQPALADDATDAALAQANADKAKYEALKAKAEATEEQIKAAQAGLPASGISNTAAAGDKAGLAETNYLAAKALDAAAGQIVAGIKDVKVPATTPPAPVRVVLFAGVTAPDLSDWQAFDAGLTEVEKLFADANKHKPGVFRPALAPALLLLAPAVLSYLASTESLQGIALTADESMLETLVAQKLLAPTVKVDAAGTTTSTTAYKVTIFNQTFNRKAAEEISTRLDALTRLRKDGADFIASPDGKKSPEAVELFKKAIARYDALIATLQGAPPAPAAAEPAPAKKDKSGKAKKTEKSEADDKAKAPDKAEAPGKTEAPTLSLATLIKERAVADALKGGYGVFLKVQNASGSIFVRKNLLTFFGAGSYSVSASAVASYSMVDGETDDVVAAGTVREISPYTDVDKVSGKKSP